MNEKDWTTQQQDPSASWEQSFYQTGSTCPPKSYRGLLAILLVWVIFLGGIASALSFWGIRLFQQQSTVSGQDDTALRFALEQISQMERCPETDTATRDATAQLKLSAPPASAESIPCSGGLSLQDISTLEQLYYQLPSGIYISRVDPGSDAAAQGIRAGDILLSCDGQRVTCCDMLQALLSTQSADDPLQLVIYRGGVQYSLSVKLGQTQ